MSVEPGLVDANVLIYAMDKEAAQCEASRALLESARDPATTLYVTSQILCEFYSVVTNPRRVVAPCSSSEALLAISALLAFPGIRVLPTPRDAIARWMKLLERHPVIGGDVFDLQLAATMQASNVQRIYTFNSADFVVFAELDVVVPSIWSSFTSAGRSVSWRTTLRTFEIDDSRFQLKQL
jgi:predicted nucleic acid-binding protein